MKFVKSVWQRFQRKKSALVTESTIKESQRIEITIIDNRSTPIPIRSMDYPSRDVASTGIALQAAVQSGYPVICTWKGNTVTISDA